jgi:hypothetical protein
MYYGIETKPQITDYNTNYKAVNKLLIYPSSFPFPSLDPIRNWLLHDLYAFIVGDIFTLDYILRDIFNLIQNQPFSAKSVNLTS